MKSREPLYYCWYVPDTLADLRPPAEVFVPEALIRQFGPAVTEEHPGTLVKLNPYGLEEALPETSDITLTSAASPAARVFSPGDPASTPQLTITPPGRTGLVGTGSVLRQ